MRRTRSPANGPDLRDPKKKEIAMQIVSSAENCVWLKAYPFKEAEALEERRVPAEVPRKSVRPAGGLPVGHAGADSNALGSQLVSNSQG